MPHQRPGYIYVLKVYNSDLYKIGHTLDPNRRLQTFNVKLPFPVEYDVLIPVSDMYGTEKALHKKYAHQHVNGEFFRLSIEDVEDIRQDTSLQCEPHPPRQIKRYERSVPSDERSIQDQIAELQEMASELRGQLAEAITRTNRAEGALEAATNVWTGLHRAEIERWERYIAEADQRLQEALMERNYLRAIRAKGQGDEIRNS